MRPPLHLPALEAGLLAGDRASLARAITLVESRLPAHQVLAAELLSHLMPRTGGALRVGVTGVPGAGKSTFIEQLGLMLVGQGSRVAVLAVDPSSVRSGGSILGDKTRMSRLSTHPSAFIRPSPAAGTLGGVAAHTREAMLLCEAAGFDVVLVETVGVGQSETVVADMTDCLLLLALSGAGDELQGIKRGILELAEVIVVNKADDDNRESARRAAHELRQALRLVTPHGALWTPPVLTASARDGVGLDEVWAQVQAHRAALKQAGELAHRREEQAVRWMRELVEDLLRERFYGDAGVAAALPGLEAAVREGRLAPTRAAHALLAAGMVGHDLQRD